MAGSSISPLVNESRPARQWTRGGLPRPRRAHHRRVGASFDVHVHVVQGPDAQGAGAVDLRPADGLRCDVGRLLAFPLRDDPVPWPRRPPISGGDSLESSVRVGVLRRQRRRSPLAAGGPGPGVWDLRPCRTAIAASHREATTTAVHQCFRCGSGSAPKQKSRIILPSTTRSTSATRLSRSPSPDPTSGSVTIAVSPVVPGGAGDTVAAIAHQVGWPSSSWRSTNRDSTRLCSSATW